MILVDKALQERENTSNPIRVGIVGAGYMAVGLINQIERYVPGMWVAAVSNRHPERARQCFLQAGVKQIATAHDPQQLDNYIRARQHSVCDHPEVLCFSEEIDVIVEATGTIDFAANMVLTAVSQQKPVILLNAELDATLGPILKHYADRHGTILSGSDGDQPGVILNQYRFVKGLGMTPLVCGNIKGFLDYHKNPTDMEAYARKVRQSPRMITNFTDGTKLSFEQASVANATGMGVAQRGMSAHRSVQHIDELTSFYDIDQLQALGGIVDFVVGPQPSPGIYVFAASDDTMTQDYLSYLKLGSGPLYSFYTPYHLCFFEVPNSIARVAHFEDAVMAPLGGPVVEVVATAKRNLKAGETLDGYGGYLAYGLCENAPICQKENLLPIGLAEGVVLKRDVPQDQVLTFDDIEYPTGRTAFALYEEQKEVFAAERVLL